MQQREKITLRVRARQKERPANPAPPIGLAEVYRRIAISASERGRRSQTQAASP